MSFLFGGKVQPKDPVKEQQAKLRQTTRGMWREECRAAENERRLTRQINDLAGRRMFPECKAKAVELIRLRAYTARLRAMRGQLTSITQQLETIKGTQHMTAAIQQTTLMLKSINKQVNPQAINRILVDYERQSTGFNAGQEIMQETMETVFEVDNETEASEEALQKVFLDLGLQEAAALCCKPATGAGDPLSDSDLEIRLARLTVPP